MDKYTCLAETTSQKTLYWFVRAINQMYGSDSLRPPNKDELKQILLDNANCGFPGCIGSLDCNYWAWKNCPVSLAGTYKGKEKYLTIVMEAVATQDQRFWLTFFGTPRALNNLNLLDKSDLFERTLHKKAPQIRSKINGNHYNSPPKGLYWLQPPAARSVAATDVKSVYQTDVTSAAPTDTLCLCSNVSVGPADIKLVWATDVTSVASGRRYRGGL
jgi:hypothetical protein